MRRQLYSVLLLTSLVLAAAVFLRPSLAEDLMGLAGSDPFVPSAPPSPYGGNSHNVVPRPPSRPIQPSRPQSWPGTPSPSRQWNQQDSGFRVQGSGLVSKGETRDPRSPIPESRSPIPNPQSPIPNPQFPEPRTPNPPQIKPCEGARIVAKVGPYAILASDVTVGVDELIEQNKNRIPPGQLETQRQLLIQKRLKDQIDTKLIYCDARQKIPKDNFPHIEENLGKEFEKNELKRMLERANVASRQELDQKLRTLGSSLERNKREFMQRTLAQSWMREQVKFDEEVSYDQMAAYYNAHTAEFDKPARTNWQQLMVRFSKYPSKSEAYAAIAGMGNRVLRGEDFAEVAKAGSHGPTASDGGTRRWPDKTMASRQLEQPIAQLPLGQMSPILEDWRGFHIIRVLERRAAGLVPFADAQAEIRKKIRQQRARKQWRTYVARLYREIPVWTIFDDQMRREQISNRPRSPETLRRGS